MDVRKGKDFMMRAKAKIEAKSQQLLDDASIIVSDEMNQRLAECMTLILSTCAKVSAIFESEVVKREAELR